MLVRRAIVGRGGLVADQRRARIEGERLEAGVDDGAVPGRADHHRRPHKKAWLEGLGRLAVTVAVAPIIGVDEDAKKPLAFPLPAGGPRAKREGPAKREEQGQIMEFFVFDWLS